MRPRTAAFSTFSGNSKGIPGPGTYNLDALALRNEHCILSTIKCYGAPLIKTGKRFNNSFIKNSREIPGPGHYSLQGSIDPKGSYTISKWRSSGA